MTWKIRIPYGHGIQGWGNTMKITKKALKQIIKEELEDALDGAALVTEADEGMPAFGSEVSPDSVRSGPVHDPRVLAELQAQTVLLQQILSAWRTDSR
jgi:hypothetical protein